MRTMFAQFWSMLTMFFSAGERLARTVDNGAKWCEYHSQSLADEAQIERELKLITINQRFNEVEQKKVAALPAPTP